MKTQILAGGQRLMSVTVLVGVLVGLFPLLGSAQDALPPSIGVVEMGAGRLFVDREGFTLYTYKRDGEQPGQSVCVDACANAWPPVAAATGAASIGNWSVISRPDGSQQWAFNSAPVYRYVRDTHAGAMAGEKASGFWDVLFERIDTPPGIQISGAEQGQILIAVDGRPAYTNTATTCDQDCSLGWRPLEAPWLAKPLNADWTILQRDDGLAQWAFQDQPLFTSLHDDNLKAASERGWQLVVLQPAPALPPWVTFQETDFGPVLADANHMTLYYMASDPAKIERETCDAQCRKENLDPVVAPAGTQPIGNWSTLKLADGALQWSYMGLGVYRFKHDRLPGDILGDKFATGAAIRDGWRAILKESLIQKLF